MSSIRIALLKLGILRSRAEGVRNAAAFGKLGSGNRGKKDSISVEKRKVMTDGIRRHAEINSRGVSFKTNSYVEYTKGVNKFRSVHVVLMEEKINRKLLPNECVHHIDGNKHNNNIGNLQLMTKSEHARIHALENLPNRIRNEYGQFK